MTLILISERNTSVKENNLDVFRCKKNNKLAYKRIITIMSNWRGKTTLKYWKRQYAKIE